MKKSAWLGFIVVSFSALFGCAKQLPIDSFVAKNSANQFFGNGFYKPINLPANAVMGEVVTQAFENAQPFPISVGCMNIVTQRQIEICDQMYTGVLVNTAHDQKLVILKYEYGSWWNGVYDVK